MSNNHPKKYLGQHFLVDPDISRKIVKIVDPQPDDMICEIGPGRGALTEYLVNSDADIYAIELDEDLAKSLKNKYGDCHNFHLIIDDVLNVALDKINEQNKITVVGNIPYNITTPIIERVIEYKQSIKNIYIMVQWEVAKRIVATPDHGKDYGSFSLFVQYHCAPEICFKVKRGSFYPVPNVDSAFIKLRVREQPKVSVTDEKLLFTIIRTAFQYRRKMLRNCLKREPLNLTKDQLAHLANTVDIDLRKRGEKLGLTEYKELCDVIDGII